MQGQKDGDGTDGPVAVVKSDERTLAEFLQDVPPGEERPAFTRFARNYQSAGGVTFFPPTIKLHCDADGGDRFFDSTTESYNLVGGATRQIFLNYACRNCATSRKAFALVFTSPKADAISDEQHLIAVRKYGEFPAFGAPTPPRLLRLLDGERPYFLKGRRAESQGMGIAAFAYYRRVVENKKTALFDQMIRVAELLKAGDEMIADLRAARAQVQFSQAVDTIKHGIPPSLLIGGHNPLTLLHSALSKGLHAETDEACLEIASSIRYVLGDLVERIDAALKDDQALMTAVSRLLGSGKNTN